MSKRAWRSLIFLLVLVPSLVIAQAPAPTGLQSDVVFSEYSPLSGAAEISRRLMSPLNALRVRDAALRSGTTLRDQVIDLSHEKFAVYVPAREPPDGYSLLVFVPPWPQAEVPRKWISTLDRHGTIYVSAANSGNEADVLDRRDPLAVLAAYNIMRRYRVDSRRVYVGGFSGGSRVALRVALGYPDVFTGVLLDAGSDPIGSAEIPLPPADLFRRFQEGTRLVYVTGSRDEPRQQMDTASQQSLEGWCVLDMTTVDMPWTTHDLAPAGALDSALRALEDRKSAAQSKLSTCRARVERELTAQLDEVEQLRMDGKVGAARNLLQKLDGRYGGLVAPRSIQLADQLGAQ